MSIDYPGVDDPPVDIEPADQSTTDNDKYVVVKHPVPRTRQAYRETSHYLQRRNDRSAPPVTEAVVSECIESGACHGVKAPSCAVADTLDVVARFAFDKRIDSDEHGVHDWRIIVGLTPVAFRLADVKHHLITAYCYCHLDDPTDECNQPE